MLETSAPVLPGMDLALRCGSITASAVVVWKQGSKVGVDFTNSLSDRELLSSLLGLPR